ncbi:PRP3-domain-containing protein [Atractiella rhizophila]|nr:PRP3-domain-containing protein [Atractiella rhizophila]
MRRKVEEASKRVAKLAAPKNLNPYLSEASRKAAEQATRLATANASSAGPAPGRSGLDIAAHPLLMSDSASTGTVVGKKNDRYKPMAPKFATTKANARVPTAPVLVVQEKKEDSPAVQPMGKDNPYFDSSLGDGGMPKERGTGRRAVLKFNQKGKWVALGESMRASARMEELKARIAETSKKAGIEEDLAVEGKKILRPLPPEVEWWDAPFLPSKMYSDVSSGLARAVVFGEVEGEKGVDNLIQHPILLKVKDAGDGEPRKMFLTKKEMKKMRRLRRGAELKDRQDRVRMGLLPPDPPKVKLSNMMRVLTSSAVADPTRIEMSVQREMQLRAKGHEKANAERKLTDEQRKEKAEEKRREDERRGVWAAAFKVRWLTNPSHKFKVRKNAEQLGLTGMAIFSSKFSLVVVEGGAKGLRKYKRLMLERIEWTEEAVPRAGDGEDEGEDGEGGGGGREKNANEEGLEVPDSLADNTCEMVWEGQMKEKRFKGFRAKICPTDSMARDLLGTRLEGVWDVAKRWTGKQEM